MRCFLGVRLQYLSGHAVSSCQLQFTHGMSSLILKADLQAMKLTRGSTLKRTPRNVKAQARRLRRRLESLVGRHEFVGKGGARHQDPLASIAQCPSSQ